MYVKRPAGCRHSAANTSFFPSYFLCQRPKFVYVISGNKESGKYWRCTS
jgi:hypothetical protein